MKIYKPNPSFESTTDFDFIDFLVDNELTLEKKVLNLSSAYEKLKLTPFAIEKLIENLLGKLNVSIKYPRKGDNNTRYDARIFLENEVTEGVVEIEVPSTAMLDAPRNLLDDIAVICNREKKIKENLIPIVICWTYPNKRTDYWNVVEDINKVLNLKLKTISIMSLAVMYWLEIPLDLKKDTFYLNTANNTVTEILERAIDEKVELKILEGYFAPIK